MCLYDLSFFSQFEFTSVNNSILCSITAIGGSLVHDLREDLVRRRKPKAQQQMTMTTSGAMPKRELMPICRTTYFDSSSL
jgi:hypothetical protein